jgi:solute carrier family 50 protein (sugar transporter)
MSNNMLADTIAPICGTIIVQFMWMSSFTAFLEIRRNMSLGSINTLPYGVMLMNCIGWMSYGIMRDDIYIFFSNATGVVLGLFYCCTSLALLYRTDATEQEKRSHMILERTIFIGFIIWLIMVFLVGIAYHTSDGEYSETKENLIVIVGWMSFSCALGYYMSPLSTLQQVMERRDSSSLYPPMIITNLINATCWTVYGFFGLHDPSVWVCNLLGMILSVVQLCLIVVYPKPKESDMDEVMKISIDKL